MSQWHLFLLLMATVVGGVLAFYLATSGGADRPTSASRRRWARTLRMGSGASLLLVAALLLCSSSWGVAVAAKGLDVDIPGYDPPAGLVAVGVRVTDPDTARAVEALVVERGWPVTIFVDRVAAAGLYPATGLSLGVAADRDQRAVNDPVGVRGQAHQAAKAIQQATGQRPAYFLPAPHDVNLTALAVVPGAMRMVAPQRETPGPARPGLRIVDLSGLGPAAASRRLEDSLSAICQGGLQCVPLDRLSS